MTNFNWLLDGSIVGLYLLITMAAGLSVRKYVGKVDDFLVAGREMNVYLGIASLAATEFGIVTCMYTAEAGYKYGFAGATPGIAMALSLRQQPVVEGDRHHALAALSGYGVPLHRAEILVHDRLDARPGPERGDRRVRRVVLG